MLFTATEVFKKSVYPEATLYCNNLSTVSNYHYYARGYWPRIKLHKRETVNSANRAYLVDSSEG